MDRRIGAAVVCLVLAAGCNGLSPGTSVADSGSTDTVTPVPVPDARGSGLATTVPGGSLPPGISADGTVDTDRLRAAHNASIEGTSYTWTYRRDRGEGANATRQFERRVSVDEATILVRVTNVEFLPNRSLYLTESEGFLQRQGERVTSVSPADPDTHHEQAPASRLIGALLPERDTTLAVVERDGRRLYRVYVPPGGPPPELRSDAGEGWAVRDYRATLYVTPAGHVRKVTVAYERDLATGDTHHVSIRFEYTGIGETTVTRPDWVPAGNRTVAPSPALARG